MHWRLPSPIADAVRWRVRYNERPAADAPTRLATGEVGTILFTGWKGWQMAYQHHVGVSNREPRRSS